MFLCDTKCTVLVELGDKQDGLFCMCKCVKKKLYQLTRVLLMTTIHIYFSNIIQVSHVAPLDNHCPSLNKILLLTIKTFSAYWAGCFCNSFIAIHLRCFSVLKSCLDSSRFQHSLVFGSGLFALQFKTFNFSLLNHFCALRFWYSLLKEWRPWPQTVFWLRNTFQSTLLCQYSDFIIYMTYNH